MANLNRVMLIGKLTRDVEVKAFANGGKVANFGFAVTGSRSKQPDGSWKDEPCFLDLKAFNSQQGRKLADLCEQYLHKGDQAFISGHLVMESWDDKQTGAKRTAIRVIVDDVQFLQPKGTGGGQQGSAHARQAAPASADADTYGANEDEGAIPF